MQRLFAVLLVLACSCHSTSTKLSAGKGIVSSDSQAPSGAKMFEPPQWKAGDRFVFEKGGRARIAVRVEVAQDGHYELVDEASGRRMLYTRELAELGEHPAHSGDLTLQFDPGDARLSWPMWVGKRWSCEFTSRAKGRNDLPLIAHYVCDAEESVTVPAGTFQCLRVWRRVRPGLEGDFADMVGVSWYAPSIGVFVRRLETGLETVLIEAQRQ